MFIIMDVYITELYNTEHISNLKSLYKWYVYEMFQIL